MAVFLHADREPEVRNTPQRSSQLASLARQALIAEAELTPKPGLVDRRGSGAHTDLSLDLMLRSATVLEPYFADMASTSVGRIPSRDLRAELAAIGRNAERAIYKATQGANSHKGAIWIFGLLVASTAQREGLNARGRFGCWGHRPTSGQGQPQHRDTRGHRAKPLWSCRSAWRGLPRFRSRLDGALVNRVDVLDVDVEKRRYRLPESPAVPTAVMNAINSFG
jgi:hypothetical protein